MPTIDFSNVESKFTPNCEHGGVHGTHTTADGRVIAICQMADVHIQSTIRELSSHLDALYTMARHSSRDSRRVAGNIESAEDKLLLLQAEETRRKYERAASQHS